MKTEAATLGYLDQLLQEKFTFERIIEFPVSCIYPECDCDNQFYLGKGVKITFCLQSDVSSAIGRIKSHLHLTMVLNKVDETVRPKINLERRSSKEMGFIDLLRPLNLCGAHCTQFLMSWG